jgi:hypothetical protein
MSRDTRYLLVGSLIGAIVTVVVLYWILFHARI